VFHVASVSKQFTAFCIALLAKEGKLSLDDDIRLYLPEMHDFGKKITLQHLIHHTSGLRDQWELLAMAGWRLDDVITTDHILQMAWRARELNFNPGDEELYCNTGYTLLAEIVSRVSKKSFRAFADSAIFKPLGMTNTHVHDSHEMIVKNRSYSYVSGPEGEFRLAPLNYANAGATSLFTTVEDLAKWINNFDQPTVGGPEVIRQMHERFTLNNGQTINYAFGLGLDTYKGLQRVGHSGGDAAFRSHLVRFPDQKFAVAILCNTGAINPSRLSEQIAEIYLANQMQTAPASNNQPQHAEAQVDTTLLRKYTGMFQLRPGWILTITLEDGKLMTQATGEGKFPMRAETPTRFFVPAYQAAVIFMPDPQSNVDTVEYRNMKAPRVFSFSPSATELEGFTGEFYSEELETSYRLKVQDGKLVALHQRNDMVSLTPTVTDQFAGNQWWFRGVQFQRNAQGAIAGFTITGGRVRYLRFVKRA
jgi:CubicO group peptidase (beta-lactamase class C family)